MAHRSGTWDEDSDHEIASIAAMSARVSAKQKGQSSSQYIDQTYNDITQINDKSAPLPKQIRQQMADRNRSRTCQYCTFINENDAGLICQMCQKENAIKPFLSTIEMQINDAGKRPTPLQSCPIYNNDNSGDVMYR